MITDDIEICTPYDPSKELITKSSASVKITIHVIQRTGRKRITQLKGVYYHISDSPKDFLAKVKKKWGCNGHIAHDEETEEDILQFMGNQKESF